MFEFKQDFDGDFFLFVKAQVFQSFCLFAGEGHCGGVGIRIRYI